MGPLLRVEDLYVQFASKRGGALEAVKGVSFSIPEGQTLSVIGESGSGKTSLARSLVRLVPLTQGAVFFKTTCISSLSDKAFFPYRKRIQMVFQDPYGSLNPRMPVRSLLQEPLDLHFPKKTQDAKLARIHLLLDYVQLPKSSLERYPHEFSGGQRQRIAIARSLACAPDLLICDEALSALDVTVQAQIIELLKALQSELNLTYLFIAHDLAVVQQLSHHVVVMKDGCVVESAPSAVFYNNPQHPYSQALLDACYSF